jgi:cell division septal protein FtsQ
MYRLIFIFIPLFFVSCTKDIALSEQDVNSKITQFIELHFPGHTIIQAIKDRDFMYKSYDVWLSDNVKLEFNRKYEIIDIESASKLPDSVIPAKILDYINMRYPQLFIKEWAKDDNRQEVELNNELTLIFSKSGDFIRIDD